MITLSKNNLDLYGKYIIQRLQNENFKCKSIHPGYNYTLALMNDGSLYACGYNREGQLGLGHTDNQNIPQLIDPDNFENKAIKSIHTRVLHTLAFMDDGSLFVWGKNRFGQLGLGHNNDQNTPQLIDRNHFPNKTIQSIHTGSHHILALMDDSSIYAWGYNHSGQLGLGHNNDQNTPHLISPNHFANKTIQSIHLGFQHTLALMDDGSLFAWGRNDKGQLGLGHTDNQITPQLIDRGNFPNKIIKSIHPGYNYTLALMNDGSLYAWGYNDKGQLGLGHTDNQITPQLINPEHFPNKTIQSIHVGTFKTFALMTDGSLFAWGFNGKGQLGLGHNNDQYAPQLIDPGNYENQAIQSIHAGSNHTLALMYNGSLYAWGSNYSGQLGLGHNEHQNTPQQIEGRLEKAFRLGHENLKSLSMFSDKSLEERINLKHQLLSLHVPMADDMEKTTEAYAQGSPSAGQT
jgi:alpha-tubulin suppressor-like RCC1 family protein